MTKLRIKDIPASHPVRPLRRYEIAKDRVTCGTCGLSWDDSISTGITPTPAGRCPFETFHKEEPKTRAPKFGIEQLRQAVTLFSNTREEFNTRYTIHELILIYQAFMRSEWDITPDRWTAAEIRQALAGLGSGATSER